MRKLFRYIYVITLLCILCSCERDEFNVSGNGSEKTIEIIARTPGFNNVNVKSAADPNRLFETAIYSAYLLIFNSDGDCIDYYQLDNELSKSISLAAGKITACIIANVPQTSVEEITSINKLNNAVLELTYSDASEADGCFGVPKLGDNLCFPMFGYASMDVTEESANSLSIDLVRLFSKVTVNLEMTLKETPLGLPTFTIYSYKLVNLPTRVSIINNGENAWEDSEFEEELEKNNINAVLYDTRTKLSDLQGILGTNIQVVPTYYTFDIYVPEYCVSPLESAIDNPKYKPENFDKDSKKPVHLQIEGEYTPVTGSTSYLQYNIFLGEDASTSFTLNRNVHYTNDLTITGISSHKDNTENIDHRVSITPGNLINIFGEVANCYIITSAGKYQLPAYKGAFTTKEELENTDNMCTEGTHVKILANPSDVKFGEFTLEKNNLGAQVIGIDILENQTLDHSNVVIALMNGNEILWSWHLWFVIGYKLSVGEGYNTGFGDADTQTMPDGSTEMMDRNLGAEYHETLHGVVGAAPGLYYQYGCKDPFIGDSYVGGGESGSGDWSGTVKSHTDPCPPGYRVPASNVWESSDATNEHTNLIVTTAFRYWNNGINDIYYPYSGYLDNRIINEKDHDNPTQFNADDYTTPVIGTKFTEEIRTEEVEIKREREGMWYKRTLQYIEHKFSEFKYEAKLTQTFGCIWGNNYSYFNYNNTVNNWGESYKILECKWSQTPVTRVQRGSDRLGWADIGSTTRGTTTTSIIQSGNNTTNVISDINNNDWKNDLKTHQSLRSFSEPQSKIEIFTDAPSAGYQVRCVKE